MAGFSADMKTTGKQGESTGKMFFSGASKHIRLEMSMRGHNAIMIVDSSNPANPSTKMLMPDQHMYMEMNAYGAGPGMKQRAPQVRAYDSGNPCAGIDGVTCTKVGVETVNGYPCDKWQFSGKENQTVWVSQQLHFPIKTVTQEGTTTEFSNIKQGPQDAGLFTVPPDYKKFDMGAMMGGGGHVPDQQ